MLDQINNQTLQRAFGKAEVTFTKDGLSHLYQSGCAKLLLPKSYTDRPEAVFINSAGGVTGGDNLSLSVKLENQAKLTSTTQAAERIYRSTGGVSTISNNITLEQNAVLDWLPQETILFDGCALDRTLTVEMDSQAAFLGIETIVFGRSAMGETLQTAGATDRWKILRGGKACYFDTFRFSNPDALSGLANLADARALTTLVYVAPDAEDRLPQARALLTNDVETAVSAWNGTLVARFLAPDMQPLRKALIAFLTEFRGRPMPRVWHM